MKTILEEALKITNGSRKQDYGPIESFDLISTLASLITDKKLTPQDIISIIISVKLIRERNKHMRDNLVDICGYLRLLSIIEGDENSK